MSNVTDIDYYKFQPQGDSPVDNDWRSAAPRCGECGRAIDEDEGCKDADCLAERESDDAERLAFVGKLTEIMIAVAREVECPKVGLTDTLKAENYLDSYDNDHDAMMLLWQAWDAASPRIRRLIVSAIGHLRESAMEEIPYESTIPNKDSHGRRYGKRV